MIYLNRITVSGFPSHFHDSSISGSIYICPRMSRKVHTGMKLRRSINRIDTRSITGSGLTKVFIGNRLNGRNTFQHLVMVLAHIHHIIKRFGLNIQSFGQYIQLLSGIYDKLGIGQVHKFFITVRTSVSCLTNSRRNRVSLQNHAVQVIITLLNILKYPHGVIQTAGKYIILRL